MDEGILGGTVEVDREDPPGRRLHREEVPAHTPGPATLRHRGVLGLHITRHAPLAGVVVPLAQHLYHIESLSPPGEVIRAALFLFQQRLPVERYLNRISDKADGA